jgi:hypothetical protein
MVAWSVRVDERVTIEVSRLWSNSSLVQQHTHRRLTHAECNR